MKNYYIGYVAFILLSCISAGCKQVPGPSSEAGGFLSSYPANGAPLGGNVNTSVIRYETPSGYADRFSNEAVFYDDSGRAVQPSSVSVNGHALPTENSWNGDQSTVTFGSPQIWSVMGTGSVPTFQDTVAALTVPQITYPRFYTDSISVSNGYTVQYASPGTDSVGIFVMYDSIKSLTHCGVHHGQRSFYVGASNTGNFNITSSDLTAFPDTGAILIVVSAIRGNWQYLSSKNYDIWSSASSECYTYLKP